MGMHVKVVALLLVLAAMSSSFLFADAAFHARVFKVGGQDGWVVSPSEPLNRWSDRQRFHKFDRLYFKYKAGEDSVLLVSKEAYENCNRTNPVNSFTDGNTSIELPHSGPLYFISGELGHCEKGQKLIIRVLADRSHAPSSQPPVLPPAISPSQPPKAPTHAPTPHHHPGKAPTAPPPSSPSSPQAAPPAVPVPPPAVPGEVPAPFPHVAAPAPAPSGGPLSARFGVAGLVAMVIGWMVMV
ncbi:early nodulin-like protein 1 [Nymphaea colorata]|nr:early nodulin-like protein 1 [Nymphaea colorata]